MSKLKRKQFEAELAVLHGELVALQEWVMTHGARVCVLFEGRDAAGKGGAIKRPHRAGEPARLPGGGAARPHRPRERSQIYMQRYVPHLPAAGEVVIFDRSPGTTAPASSAVMGFCTPGEVEQFLSDIPTARARHRRRRQHADHISTGLR